MGKIFEVVDRASGETIRLEPDSDDAKDEVYRAAAQLEITHEAAWETLRNGGTLATAGFYRRIIINTKEPNGR